MGKGISEEALEQFKQMSDAEKIGALKDLMVTVTDPLKLILSIALVIDPENVNVAIQKTGA